MIGVGVVSAKHAVGGVDALGQVDDAHLGGVVQPRRARSIKRFARDGGS
jgi:hypothetical protein